MAKMLEGNTNDIPMVKVQGKVMSKDDYMKWLNSEEGQKAKETFTCSVCGVLNPITFESDTEGVCRFCAGYHDINNYLDYNNGNKTKEEFDSQVNNEINALYQKCTNLAEKYKIRIPK